MLTTLFLLAAAAGRAAPQAAPLDSFDRVRELCAGLRSGAAPADRLYRVEVGSKGFTFGQYRAAEEAQELDGDRPLRAAEGALLLDLAQTDDVAFHASAEQRDEWKRQKDEGKLTLSIVFEPSAEGCVGNVHARQLRLAGSARSWRLLGEQGKLLAAADAEGTPVAHADGPRAVKILSVSIEGEAPREDDGRGRLAPAQASLDACVRSAAAEGSLVLSFVAKAGRLHDVQVAVDGLHDDAVSGCLAKAVGGASVGGALSGKGTAAIAVE